MVENSSAVTALTIAQSQLAVVDAQPLECECASTSLGSAAAGTIRAWREPAGNGIRIDTGFRAGDAVTPYYDALLAKLIAWGADRPQALGDSGRLHSVGELVFRTRPHLA